MTLPELPRIERLDLSLIHLPDWHPEAANGGEVPVYGYVVDHPDGAIVFDTGVGFGNDFIDEAYAPRSERLAPALAAVGIEIESVAMVVNSHLHFDHCGQNPLFFGTGVPIHVQAPELDAVAADRFYTDPEWARVPDGQRSVLQGDAEIAEGVTVLSTPGHTPGHQSLLVEGGGERVILAGQLVWALGDYHQPRASPSNIHDDDWAAEALDSINRVRSLGARQVHFGLCPHHESV